MVVKPLWWEVAGVGVVVGFPTPCEVKEEVCLGASRLVLKGGGTVVVMALL